MQMKKLLSLILALSLVLALGTAALAGDTDFTRAADITYRGISIIVNGTKIVPQDANGNPVEPFIMDGTTYLPVRAVAGALGLDVSWNGATSTVILTSGGKTVYGSGRALATNGTRRVDITYRDIAIEYNGDRIYATTADGYAVEPFIMDGTTYLPVRGVANALGLDVSWDGATSTVTLGRSAGYYTYRVSREYTVTEYEDETTHLEVRYEYTPDAYLYRTVTDDDGLVYTMTNTLGADGIVQRVTITGDRTGEEVYEYDKNGSVTVTSTGWTNAVRKEVCNEDHVLTQTYYEDYDGGYSQTINYFYNTNGDLIRMEETWDFGDGAYTDTTIYERDSLGRAVRETKTCADGSKDVTTCTYGDGYKPTLRRTVCSDGTVIEERMSYRDYQIESRTVHTDGKLSYSLKNEYDANGNVVKSTEYGGYYTAVTTYEYVSIYVTY